MEIKSIRGHPFECQRSQDKAEGGAGTGRHSKHGSWKTGKKVVISSPSARGHSDKRPLERKGKMIGRQHLGGDGLGPGDSPKEAWLRPACPAGEHPQDGGCRRGPQRNWKGLLLSGRTVLRLL